MEKYRIIKKIGSGSQAVAFLAHEVHNTQSLVVLKRMPEGVFSASEKHVMQKIKHPNIIACKETFTHEEFFYLVLQYAEGGDLEQYLHKLGAQHKSIPTQQVVNWFVQICSALQYCHQNRVIHRDIKPGNIFLSKDYQNVFLGDFGVAKILDQTIAVATTLVGSPMALSPEVISGTPYSYMSDIWSLGCVLYEMVAMKKPFEAANFAQLVMKVCSGQFEPLPKGTPEFFERAIQGMLNIDVNERWDINDVLTSDDSFHRAPCVVALPKPKVGAASSDLDRWVKAKQRDFANIEHFLADFREADNFLLKKFDAKRRQAQLKPNGAAPQAEIASPPAEPPPKTPEMNVNRAKRMLASPQAAKGAKDGAAPEVVVTRPENARVQTPPSAMKQQGRGRGHKRSKSDEEHVADDDVGLRQRAERREDERRDLRKFLIDARKAKPKESEEEEPPVVLFSKAPPKAQKFGKRNVPPLVPAKEPARDEPQRLPAAVTPKNEPPPPVEVPVERRRGNSGASGAAVSPPPIVVPPRPTRGVEAPAARPSQKVNQPLPPRPEEPSPTGAAPPRKFENDRQNLRAMIREQRAQQKALGGSPNSGDVPVEIMLPSNLRNLPQNKY